MPQASDPFAKPGSADPFGSSNRDAFPRQAEGIAAAQPATQEEFRIDEADNDPVDILDDEDCTMDVQGGLLDGHRKRDVMPLYMTHFLSTFGDRMWQFAVPVLFVDMWQDTLLPSAVFSFGVCVACFFGMVYVGEWIDRTPRLQALQTFIIAEAVAIVFAAVFFFILLSVGAHNEDGRDTFSMRTTPAVEFCFALLLIASVAAELMARGGTMALEKDWLVVIAQGDAQYQTHLNTRMRRIDLTCKFLGPLAFGLLCQYLGTDAHHRVKVGVMVVAVWNVIFVPLEYYTMLTVYHTFPELGEKELSKIKPRTSPLDNLTAGWTKYLSQPILVASLGYCQLYMTTLSDHDVLGTAFLKWSGVPESLLGVSRGVGAVMGLAGTFVFPVLLNCVGSLELAGVISVWCFLAILAPIGAAFASGTANAPYIMLGCIVASRGALWSFDLAIQQIMQERIAEADRGAVNGVHGAVCQLMFMAIAACGLIFHDPGEFTGLVYISLGSVAGACVLFTHWARQDGAL